MPEPDSSGTERWSPWALLKGSTRLAGQDPSLASLAFLGSGCFMVLLAASMGVVDRVSPGRQDFAFVLLFFLGGFYAATLLLSFFSAAMAHAAGAGFDGLPLTMREAIAEARQDLGAIAIWSLVAVAVGVVLQILVATGPTGRLVSFLVSLVWGFLVAYTVPIIALAAASPDEAIRESMALARRRWGTQLIGGLLIAIATAIAAFICLMFFVPGLEGLREGKNQGLAGAATVMGGLSLAFTLIFSFAASQAFLVGIFRLDSGESSLEELESPPPPPPAEAGRPALRIGGLIAGILVVAALVGVLTPKGDPNRHDLGAYVPENGWYYATFNRGAQVPLSAGSPVIHGERQVGVVVESRLEPSRVVVWFRADPGLQESIESNPKRVDGIGNRHYLRVGPQDRSDPESTGLS